MNTKLFHYRHSDGFLNKVNPVVKLLMLIILSLINSLLDDLFVILFFIICVCVMALNRINFLSVLKQSIFFIIIGVVFFITSHSVFKMLRYYNMVLICIIFTYTTSVFDLSYSLTKYALLRKTGKILSLTLIMIPLALDSFSQVILAYRSRNFSIIKHPFSSLTFIVINGTKKYIEKVTSFSDSLQSRLFQV